MYALLLCYYVESFYEHADIIAIGTKEEMETMKANAGSIPSLDYMTLSEDELVVVPIPQNEPFNTVQVARKYTSYFGGN